MLRVGKSFPSEKPSSSLALEGEPGKLLVYRGVRRTHLHEPVVILNQKTKFFLNE
jgi:hypothetical protein